MQRLASMSSNHPDELSPSERREAKKRVAPTVGVVYEAIRDEGQSELERPPRALAWSGLAAGLSMGFSLVAQALLASHLPDTPWRPLVVHLGYAVGFLVVILARQQLFTENTLTPVLPLLIEPSVKRLGVVLRLWAIVLATNLLGALLFAVAVTRLPIFEPHVRDVMRELSTKATDGSFGVLFVKGIFAGWLIALMVWMMPAAKTARLSIIIIITYLVGLGRLSHVVAGAVEAFALSSTGAASWGHALGYVAAALLGNIVGGVALTTALNHAQTTAAASTDDEEEEPEHRPARPAET